LSRFRILVLLASLAVAVTALSACGGGSDSSSEDPNKVVERATLEGIKSGELELSLHAKAEGKEGGEADVSLSGPFQAGARGELPEAQLQASVSGEGEGQKIDFEGGVTLLRDRAFVAYEGDQYEVDPTTFGFLKSGIEQAEQESGGESADVTACQKAAEGIKFSQFMKNTENQGSSDVGGTSTTKISGELDVAGAIDTIDQLAEDPACASQLEAAGKLPLSELEEAKSEVAGALKKAHMDLYVGDDDIIRKVDAELLIEPKDAKGERVEVEFELSLSGVNEDQTISGPSNAKPLEALFQKLGVNPLELLQAGSGGGLGGLLEGVGGGGSSGSSGGSSGGSSSGAGSAAEQQAYVECLQKAKSAADIQGCASLLK
jgi:hypothetical protein